MILCSVFVHIFHHLTIWDTQCNVVLDSGFLVLVMLLVVCVTILAGDRPGAL